MEDVKSYLRQNLQRNLVVEERECQGQSQLDIAAVEGLNLSDLASTLSAAFGASCFAVPVAGGRSLRLRIVRPRSLSGGYLPRAWWWQLLLVTVLLGAWWAGGRQRVCDEAVAHASAPVAVAPPEREQQRLGVPLVPPVARAEAAPSWWGSLWGDSTDGASAAAAAAARRRRAAALDGARGGEHAGGMGVARSAEGAADAAAHRV